MAGSFVSPSSAPPKMKHGKPNRPKRTAEDTTGLSAQPRSYPITDSLASSSIAGYASRKRNTNPKYGFNCVPARAPAGRLARIQGPPDRGAGKVVGRDERPHSAANEERTDHEDLE